MTTILLTLCVELPRRDYIDGLLLHKWRQIVFQFS